MHTEHIVLPADSAVIEAFPNVRNPLNAQVLVGLIIKVFVFKGKQEGISSISKESSSPLTEDTSTSIDSEQSSRAEFLTCIFCLLFFTTCRQVSLVLKFCSKDWTDTLFAKRQRAQHGRVYCRQIYISQNKINPIEGCNMRIIEAVVPSRHFTNLRFVGVAGCIGCLARLCFPAWLGGFQ